MSETPNPNELSLRGMDGEAETDGKGLIPERYPQHDLFVCDVADAVLKDIMPQMEYPFYSLSKKPETTVRRYEHNGDWLEVVPSVKGLATIYDKDILIYCISQIIHKLNRGEDVSRRVRINSRDLLMFTNRGTAGKDYHALCEALDRLDGTRIRTNVRRGEDEQFNAFGLIESAAVARKFGLDGRLLWCEVTLSEWVFEAIREREVLTLHRDYFRLRKPLERRIYEIARKHCGQKPEWSIGDAQLFRKSGSKAPYKQFRRVLRNLAAKDHLPDYRVTFDAENDRVIFTNRGSAGRRRTIEKLESDGVTVRPLQGETFEMAREVAPGWDVYYLEREWRDWITEAPRDPDRAFLGFCRKWFERRGEP